MDIIQLILTKRCKDTHMVTKFPQLDIGTAGGMLITEVESTTIFMTQIEDNTMLTINGIHTLDGGSKSKIRLLLHTTLILTSKHHIIITMILEAMEIIGTE
jgi:hypothetical protein